MIKKVIIGLSILFLVSTAAVVQAFSNASQPKVPSQYVIGIKYEEAIKSDKPMLALFYVDWCGYCLKFMPRYKLIHSLYKDKFNVVMINAEYPQYKQLVEDVALAGFPTLYIIDKKYDNRILLNNSIYSDLKKLRIELDRFLRIRSLLDK